MKQELPNLVDERRFRRREPEAVERDEFGRVSPLVFFLSPCAEEYVLKQVSFRGNGPRSVFPLIWSRSKVSIFELRLLARAEHMSSISSRRLAAKSRSKDVVPASGRCPPIERAMSPCTCMLRKSDLPIEQ
jgi:hypothetical protein